jgi:quinol monooxygenase YgiN
MKFMIEVLAKQGKYQEIYQTLQALLTMIRKEKGCRECRIYRDTENGEVFFLAVDWEEEADLVQYLRSNSGSALLGAVELLSETTRVRIGSEEPWEGIEILKKIKREK